MSQYRARPTIKALLIDISGTLHVGNLPTPNAVQAFHHLRKSGIPFRLCSNASKESTASVTRRLNKLGFNITPGTPTSPSLPHSDGAQRKQCPKQKVWTSIGTLAQYVKDSGLKRPYFLLSPSAMEEVTHDTSGETYPYDAVVIGLAPQLLDYTHLNTAFRILTGEHDRHPSTDSQIHISTGRPRKIPLIATHKVKYLETESPPGLSLGPGPFVAALEMAADVRAHVIGKPTTHFFQIVIDDLYKAKELSECQNDSSGKIAIIGDDVEADLGDGAVKLGLWRVLVKTGKYRDGDENRPGISPPDEVFESFSAFMESLLTIKPEL